MTDFFVKTDVAETDVIVEFAADLLSATVVTVGGNLTLRQD